MTELMHPLAAAHRVDGASGEVFIGIHGFTGSPAHLRLLAEHVHQEHGHTVVLPRLAGHGTSIADMATTGRRHWWGSVAEVMHEFSGRRIHLFGFSMGGLLALKAAAQFPVASLTTLNAPLINRDPRAWLSRVGARFRPVRLWPPGGEVPSDEAARYWIHYDGMPTPAIWEVSRLRLEARSAARQVEAPTLIIQSKLDETVRPESAGWLAHAVGATERLLWLESSPHNALLFGERDIIHRAVSDHLRGPGMG